MWNRSEAPGWLKIVALIALIFLIGLYVRAELLSSKPEPTPEKKPSADTTTVEDSLKAAKKARDEARDEAKTAAADRAIAAIDAATALRAKTEAEIAKKAVEEAKVDVVEMIARLKPSIPVYKRRPPPPRVSATSLIEDLSSDNVSTIDEAVLQLARRPDVAPKVVEKFATGDIQMKRRAWSCLKGMGEPARLKLNEIIANPDKWEARILGAAREILIKGFRQNLEADNNRDNMARCSEQVQLMIANLNAKTRELRDINTQLLNLTLYGRLRDAEQARELERIRDDYKREIVTLRGELESKGIKVIYTAIQIPVPVPIPQVQMVYPQCR